ncbi:Cellulase (glycosyl hydrolase family 5) [Mycolicibacterium rutilum]|uniref:Cellulase (Glycosyl hydrolase family 5) n=1 Tax=Mycolicibacterium rutilum TaxID=370526 RepID=A0A1H6LTU8_MYCRU|nr:cellulase family glycosylhydrolase [Mycolicibacterium rutilum]SEH92144.1 Cellulase (glycosyl hydrolase family 5) [Mycolicibacterium rutilum]
MRWWTPPRRRWSAVLAVIMMVPMAAMLMAPNDLLSDKRRLVAMPYVLTAAIEESGSTVGMADSHIWELTTPAGQPDYAAMDEHLEAMQQLGIDTVRVIIPWRGNEPWGPPGTVASPIEQSYWARSDYIINRAPERGMAVLGVLNHAPEWGSAFPEPWATIGFEEAPDPELYAEYAARVVERYGDKVGAYEIWNEPNAVTGWAPNIDAALYTEVLKAAYTAIKNVNGDDPNDPLVVAGVLGAVVTTPLLTLDPRAFVATMYASGAQGYFDALSFHPYHYSLPFSEGEVTNSEPWKINSPLEQVIAIRQLMLANGDADLRIWATEYGLPTFGLNGVTEDQQRDYIKDFLDAWAKLEDEDGTNYAGPAFLYTLRDAYLNGELTEATSLGLFKYDILTGEWIAKEAAKWLKDFLADPTNPTDPPPASGGPSNLGEAIAQAMQAFFEQIRATVQLFQQQVEGLVNSVNAMMRAVAQAIASIFNPRSAVAPALAPEVQDAVAAGARTAASALAAETQEPTADVVGGEESADASKTAVETVESEPVVVETAPTVEVEPVSAPEVTSPVEVPASEQEAVAVEGSAADEESNPGAMPTEVDSVTDETREDETGTGTADPVVATDDDTDLADEAATKSRQPDVRVGIVARPGGTGDDDGDVDDAKDSAPSTETADDTDDSADTSSADSSSES